MAWGGGGGGGGGFEHSLGGRVGVSLNALLYKFLL